MRRTHIYRGELESGHPRFPTGSSAACVNIKDGESANGFGPGHNGHGHSGGESLSNAFNEFLGAPQWKL